MLAWTSCKCSSICLTEAVRLLLVNASPYLLDMRFAHCHLHQLALSPDHMTMVQEPSIQEASCASANPTNTLRARGCQRACGGLGVEDAGHNESAQGEAAPPAEVAGTSTSQGQVLAAGQSRGAAHGGP